MSYAAIQPPFSLKVREMSMQELKDYAKWFFEVIEDRIAELAKAVTETPGFETWRADYTSGSLDLLGEWFSQQVETRPRTSEELKNLQNRLVFPIELADWELTNKTFSLAMDIGMYFGQVLKNNHSTLQWEQFIKNKKFADYGQLVLVGFGKVPLNPVRIITTLAYGLVDKKRTHKRLKELYAVWEAMISPESGSGN
jgi:hypothetical protein